MKHPPRTKSGPRLGKWTWTARKKERIQDQPGPAAEVTFQNPIKKEPENELLGQGRDRDREHDDKDALLERFRTGKHLDDLLLLRAFTEQPARNAIGHEEAADKRRKAEPPRC